MAKLTITDQDILKATPPEAGWHLFEICEFEAKDRTKATPAKEGWEYKFQLRVLKSNPDCKESNVGREIPCSFYSTGMGFMMPFVSAVLEIPIKEKLDFDPDEFVAQKKQVMGEVVKGIWNNKETLKVPNFAPASGCPF